MIEAVRDIADRPVPWCKIGIGDVARFVRGVSYEKHQASSEPGEQRIALLRANNIVNGTIAVSSDLVYVPESVVAEEQVLRPGDILFAMSSGSRNLVGKSALFTRTSSKYTFGAFCGVLRPITTVAPAFLSFWFQAPWYRRYVTEIAKGTNINNLKQEHLLTFTMPLPPLVEQRAIVAKIEALFSELDKGIELLKTVKQQLKQYRQAVLKAAFEGKLTAEWRSKQQAAGRLPSADEVLEQIKKEQEERYQRELQEWEQAVAEWEAAGGIRSGQKKPRKPCKHESIPPLTAHELSALDSLPWGWLWVRIGQVFRVAVGSTPRVVSGMMV